MPSGVVICRNPSNESTISTSSPRSRRPSSTERTASGFELIRTRRYPTFARSAPFAGGFANVRGGAGGSIVARPVGLVTTDIASDVTVAAGPGIAAASWSPSTD